MRTAAILILALTVACTSDRPADPRPIARPDIVATNAFYYYADVDEAWAFYRDILGLETVIDYGFAKILRLADSSYLTLVQASEGMHTADEPKTVTLNLVTDELSRWHAYLASEGVSMLIDNVNVDDRVSNNFVAADPNGYALKFIRYNPHPNHADYVAAFADAEPVQSSAANRPGPLSIRAAAHAIYFESLADIRPFYESLFETAPIGQLNGEDTYQLSSSGFLVLVEGADELHSPTETNGVTLSFLTSDVDAWFARATSWEGFELRTPEVLNEGGRVKVFVGYDPAGVFLEWDTFLDVPENAPLLGYLP
jgi:predicted enzyme related to lactoylglutathione lyase